MNCIRRVGSLLGLFILSSLAVKGQVKFNEGVLEYRVQIKNEADTIRNEGTFTIHIKEGNVRKELKLNNGYDHVTLTNYNLGKHIILQKFNKHHYAVEMPEKEYRKKSAKYSNAQYYQEGSWLHVDDSLQETNGKRVDITYRHGKTISAYVLDKYYLDYPRIFEQMPEIVGIPVAFQIESGNNYTMSFRLIKCNPQPISNNIFRIPEGYRIISHQEYDKLAK